VTLLPPTRASNSVTAGNLPGRDRRPRYARACGTPAPRDLPADLGWPGGRQTDSVPVKPPLGAHECSLAPPGGSGAAVSSGAPR
jgi:hypothetical protein